METTRQRRRGDRIAEERRFLDALCFWRTLYAVRGPQDRTAVATVADVIAEASARLATATAPPALAA